MIAMIMVAHHRLTTEGQRGLQDVTMYLRVVHHRKWPQIRFLVHRLHRKMEIGASVKVTDVDHGYLLGMVHQMMAGTMEEALL